MRVQAKTSPSSTFACTSGLSGSSGRSNRGGGRARFGWREASRDSQRAAGCLHSAPPNPQRAGESPPTLVRTLLRAMNTHVLTENELPSTLFPLLVLQSGRRARGLQTSTFPEKHSSWFSPLISGTTIEAWACWRTAAELHRLLRPLFTSLRSDLHYFLNCTT